MNARYLLRFDDFCPTMNWAVWARVEKILMEFDVRPILSVVPDNKDPALNTCEPNEGFWEDVRMWQKRGWTIGLHGYQHLFSQSDAGIVGINQFTEFSGFSFETQLLKISRSIEIFEREGVNPEVWVAPGHSFDETTLMTLGTVGIKHLSDGLRLFPHLDSFGVLWVPQQLWRFHWMPFGIWTVCLHLNSWTAQDVAKFRSDVKRFRPSIVDFGYIVNSYAKHRSYWFDGLYAWLHLAILKASRVRKRVWTGL